MSSGCESVTIVERSTVTLPIIDGKKHTTLDQLELNYT